MGSTKFKCDVDSSWHDDEAFNRKVHRVHSHKEFVYLVWVKMIKVLSRKMCPYVDVDIYITLKTWLSKLLAHLVFSALHSQELRKVLHLRATPHTHPLWTTSF